MKSSCIHFRLGFLALLMSGFLATAPHLAEAEDITVKADDITDMKSNLKPFQRHQILMEKLTPEMTYRGDFKNWKQKAGATLEKILGFDLLLAQERPPLKPQTLWKRTHELGTIEKVVFTSEVGADVVAYVCLPKDIKPPYTFFICLQGHATGMHVSIAGEMKNEGTPIKVEGDRDFALECMRRGIAALCIEQRGFGERRDNEKVPTDCQDAAMRALMLGRTLLAERVYDVDRGIDYLLSRGDADPKRIGVMGNSGGGTTSMFAGALLPRITHVMPSCSFSSFKASVMSMTHCTCNYVPGLLNYGESADVLGLIAPRPLVIVNGQMDEIFPIAAANSEFKRLQQIYADAGAPANCQHVIGDGGHRFYAADAWPVMLKFLQ